MKGFIDLLIFIILFPLIIILIPLISLFIIIFDSRPILFSQLRMGRHGKEFKFYKFRTMEPMSSDELHKQHYRQLSNEKLIEPSLEPSDPIRIENDDRITKVGKFLRKTSLDELPNIFNVLFGHMSFIGPRPLVKYEAELYGDYLKKRNSVKPGISGLAQIQGRLDLSLQERLYWDLKYIEELSVLNDLKIIFKTIKSVLSRKGAN